MADDLGFSAADATSLLGPKLVTFEWSFSVNDQHGESVDEFGSREEDWVRGLARAAIARRAALRTIKIEFNPEGYGVDEQGVSPWDRMDDINKEVAPRGVTLDYGVRPSKDEWEQLMKESGEQSENSDDTDDADADNQITLEPEGRDIRRYFRL